MQLMELLLTDTFVGMVLVFTSAIHAESLAECDDKGVRQSEGEGKGSVIKAVTHFMLQLLHRVLLPLGLLSESLMLGSLRVDVFRRSMLFGHRCVVLCQSVRIMRST